MIIHPYQVLQLRIHDVNLLFYHIVKALCWIENWWLWRPFKCHVQESSLRLSQLCHTAYYPEGGSHKNMGTLWSYRDRHVSNYSQVWCLNEGRLVQRALKCTEKYPLHHHAATISLNHWNQNERSRFSCCLCSVLTPLSECCSWNQDSSDKTGFFRPSLVSLCDTESNIPVLIWQEWHPVWSLHICFICIICIAAAFLSSHTSLVYSSGLWQESIFTLSLDILSVSGWSLYTLETVWENPNNHAAFSVT